MMRKLFSLILSLLFVGVAATAHAQESPYADMGLKPRVVILTDIAPGNVEPDDMESMIRLMAHADLFEIEALVATSGWNSGRKEYPVEWMDSLKTVINHYEKDLPNLMRRSNQRGFSLDENLPQSIGYWPSAEYMRSRIMLGSRAMGQKHIGEQNRSAASDYIIRLADEQDERPLWILAWGGANTLAQAVWQVEQERTQEQVREFLSKLRVYTITDQDVPWLYRHSRYAYSSHQRLRKMYADELLFIWDESAWLSQNGIGASNWDQYATHIQGHGHMGAIYPKNKYGVEGDTPSFLHVLPNGLNDPSVPEMVGWGGYFQRQKGMDKRTECYTNHQGATQQTSQQYEQYFYPAIFNNFAARMDWAHSGEGNRNPIVVVDDSVGLDIIHRKVKAGSSIRLSAEKSYDLDGDALQYRWWGLRQAGSYAQEVVIDSPTSATVTVHIPADAASKSIHIICEVQDDGIPALTAYRRVILEVE